MRFDGVVSWGDPGLAPLPNKVCDFAPCAGSASATYWASDVDGDTDQLGRNTTMTKFKLALVAITCLAFAPAALAEDLDQMPPNSAEYGYTDGSQTKRHLGGNGYDASAQAPSHGRTLWMGPVAPSRGAPFTAEEKALFDRQSAEIF